MTADREFTISGYLTISVVKTVAASSRREALRKARELAVPSLCHRCSHAGDRSSETWELNGFDDPPADCVRYIDGKAVKP